MIDPHREVRHQRALDVPHHLLRSQLLRRKDVDLLDRSVVAGENFRRYDARKGQDEILCPLDRKYRAGYR